MKLTSLLATIQTYQARNQLFRSFMVRSSVACILRESELGIEVLLIKRAERKGDRWSGHMAFPGGRAEDSDATAKDTAIRETQEEIGLQLTEESYQGRLSDVMTLAHGSRRPMVVSPYVFVLPENPVYKLNHEVDVLVWVPLAFFADATNRDKMNWQKGGVNLELPCYVYEGYRIWGLTLKMLDELINKIYIPTKTRG